MKAKELAQKILGLGAEYDLMAFTDEVINICRNIIDKENTPSPEKAVIEGWVARDGDDTLFFHQAKPIRGNFYWGTINVPAGASMILPKDFFPSITWESEPQRVKIEITLIDEKGE